MGSESPRCPESFHGVGGHVACSSQYKERTTYCDESHREIRHADFLSVESPCPSSEAACCLASLFFSSAVNLPALVISKSPLARWSVRSLGSFLVDMHLTLASSAARLSLGSNCTGMT